MLKIRDFEYTIIPIGGGKVRMHVDHNKDVPEKLYYYQALCPRQVSNFLQYRFYANVPENLNDLMDSSLVTIDYDNINIQAFDEFFSRNPDYSEYREEFKINPQQTIIKLYKEVFRQHNDIVGIVCLTSEPTDELMWTHYARNEGFVLGIRHDKLPSGNFSKPIPINYLTTEELSELYHREIQNFKDLTLRIHANYFIKGLSWTYENEFRIYANPQFTKQFHTSRKTFFHNEDKLSIAKEKEGSFESREIYYSPDLVDEIILGFNFFRGVMVENSIVQGKGFKVCFDDMKGVKLDMKLQILNAILQRSLKTSMIYLNRKDRTLSKSEIIIQKEGSKVFWIQENNS